MKRIFNNYKHVIGKLYSDYDSAPLVKVVQQATVDFCHTCAKEKHELRGLDWLAGQEEFVLPAGIGGDKGFPERAGFLGGCVRVGGKNKNQR